MTVADHFGILPSALCSGIRTALRTTLLAPTGNVKTIERIENDQIDTIRKALTNGLPAILILWSGANTAQGVTTGQRWDDMVSVSLLCCSGFSRSLDGRMDSEGVHPGVEELMYGARYIALRAAYTIGARKIAPKALIPAAQVEPGLFVGSVDFNLVQQWDIYDDQPTAVLARLGLVANPLDQTDLWTDDLDEDPNIADPATKQGGVVTLGD
jgi:hypothetical protein